MLEYLCKSCGKTFARYNSLQNKCGLCSYNGLAKPKKPIKRVGAVTKKWIDTRKQWIVDNPPGHDGKWACALHISPLCLSRMDIDQLTVDHIKSRTRRPDLRYEQTNLQAACMYCNQLKGSA